MEYKERQGPQVVPLGVCDNTRDQTVKIAVLRNNTNTFYTIQCGISPGMQWNKLGCNIVILSILSNVIANPLKTKIMSREKITIG